MAMFSAEFKRLKLEFESILTPPIYLSYMCIPGRGCV